MPTQDTTKEVDRIMRAVSALARGGVEIEATITYKETDSTIYQQYDSATKERRKWKHDKPQAQGK